MIKTYKIKKGRNSAFLSFNKPVDLKRIKQIEYWVSINPFDYLLSSNDQMDWNKLIGFSFGLFPTIAKGKIYRPVHYNSVRVVWRYNPQSKGIELVPYIYQNGTRIMWEDFTIKNVNWKLIQLADQSKFKVKFIIDYDFMYEINEISIFINDIFSGTIQYSGKMFNWGWYQTPYFGGNNPAPNDIDITISN